MAGVDPSRVPRILRGLLTPERLRFLRFCVVGASGVVVNLAVFTLLVDVLLVDAVPSDERRFVVSNLGGFVVSVLTNFLLNDVWTWADRDKRGTAHLLARLIRFCLVASIAGGVQLGTAWFVRTSLGVWDQGAVLIGIGVATVINFVVNNLWTFR